MFTYENNTIDGTCSDCGKCCTVAMPMTHNEYKMLHSKFHTLEIDFVMSLSKCPFRTNEGCLIYNFRPKVCQAFLCYNTPEQNWELVDALCKKELSQGEEYHIYNLNALFV